MTTKPTQRPRDQLAGPEGTADKLKRLAALLTVEKGVPVNQQNALAYAVNEALARAEKRGAK